jgi:lysophospholipase L1-like esterase
MRWIDRPLAAVIVWCLAGCGTAREQGTPSHSAASTAGASGPHPAASATSTAVAALPSEDAGVPDGDAGESGEAGGVAADPPKKRSGELARFYTALDGLAAGTRKEHVRMLWLGDSHGQADFWSGRLRTILQKRFGNGGPGFVHIAYKGYRHDGVELAAKDKWFTTPKGPASSKTVGDGVFGLGGLLTSTTSAGAEAAVEVREGSLTGKIHWDLCYRFSKAGDSITVSLTGKKPITLSAGAKLGGYGPLQHMKLTTDASTQPAAAPAKDEAATGNKDAAKKKGPRLTVAPASGYPFFCGVVIESDPAESPGVVLDVAGINGARYTTALAWSEEPWVAELMRRSPELVLFEYGTNESGDVGIGVDVYRDKVARLVARIRKQKPETDCAVLAPTERADQEERSARMRDILRDAAKENGCFFWDTIEVMGGKGAMRAWRDDNPPKGAKDGVHLTVKGYQELGDRLAADLLKKY